MEAIENLSEYELLLKVSDDSDVFDHFLPDCYLGIDDSSRQQQF